MNEEVIRLDAPETPAPFDLCIRWRARTRMRLQNWPPASARWRRGTGTFTNILLAAAATSPRFLPPTASRSTARHRCDHAAAGI